MCVCVCVCVQIPPKEYFFFASFSLSKKNKLNSSLQPTFVEERRVTPDAASFGVSSRGPMDPSSSGGSSSSSVPPCKFFLAGSCTKPDCAFAHDVQRRRQRRCVRFTRKGGKTAARTGTNAGTTTSPNAGRRRGGEQDQHADGDDEHESG